MIKKNLLQPFYQELLEIMDEETMLKVYQYYQGLTITFPKKLYDGKMIKKELKLLGKIEPKERQELARKYGYSQRQIERWLNET